MKLDNQKLGLLSLPQTNGLKRQLLIEIVEHTDAGSFRSSVLLDNSRYIPTVPPHWIHFVMAITGAWVGLLGRLWYILVEEGLPFLLRYHGPI